MIDLEASQSLEIIEEEAINFSDDSQIDLSEQEGEIEQLDMPELPVTKNNNDLIKIQDLIFSQDGTFISMQNDEKD